MTTEPRDSAELTLDPADWESLRQLGHSMFDTMIDYLRDVRERPAWSEIPSATKAHFRSPLQRGPLPAAGILDEFKEYVLPYPLGNIHPRFWGWVVGTGSPLGMVADMLASGMNSSPFGAEHITNDIELQVLDWCRSMLDFTREGGGILVSGGSVANLYGLIVARNSHPHFDGSRGLQGGSRSMTLYCSTETHSSVRRGAEILGIGNSNVRQIPVDDHYEVDVREMRKRIQEDRLAGLIPFCIVGNAGTVNTGAIDNLSALASLAAEEKVWFHVDGAFGAAARLVPEFRDRLEGMSRADSLAFDLHKWFYVNYAVGAILFRDPEKQRNAFRVGASYLAHNQRGTASGNHWFSEHGFELSRPPSALKVWMMLKEQGLDRYSALIAQNIDQARYLVDRIREKPELELMAPAPLNIVCFRYRGDLRDDHEIDQLNPWLLEELQVRGIAVPSLTKLHGRYVLRIAITNHRSVRADFDLLVRETVKLGRAGVARMQAAGEVYS